MTNEIIEFYREHLKPIIQKMLLETNYQGQGEVDYEEFGRDFDELLDLAIIGMQSNSDEDCISRKAVLDALNKWDWQELYLPAHFKGMIDDLPSIQPKPKTGHWMEDDMTYCGVELVNYKCDKCGEMGGAWRKGLKPDKLPKYCMNCGAKMLPTDSEKE